MSGRLEWMGRTLLKEWDPIGVADFPEARDEYDLYAPRVLDLLQRGEGADALADYLEWVVTERMGLPGNPAYSRTIAGRLIQLYLAFSAH